MIRPIFALALCLMMLGPAVQAAELTRFQVVPQAGFRLGGKFVDAETDAGLDLADAGSFGVGLEWRVGNENRWWQLWYSRQGSEVKTQDGSVDVDVEYLHVGGTAPIDDEGKVHSYVAAGIGATRIPRRGAWLPDTGRFGYVDLLPQRLW
jgi:hypothetical protein